MTTRENRWENLPAAGQGPFSPAEEELLSALLARAAAPATPAELRGEAQALAHFHRCAGAPAPSPRTLSLLPLARSVVTRKRLLAGVASTAVVGGLAASAVAGVLPSRFFHAPPEGERTRPAVVSGQPRTSASTTQRSTSSPPGTPAPHVVPGLCRFWLLTPGDPATELAGLPLFRPLLAAAGNAEAVDAHCLAQVGPPPTCPSPEVTGLTVTAGPGREPQREQQPPELARRAADEAGATPPPDPQRSLGGDDAAAVPRGWPRPDAGAWPDRWPDAWPTAGGSDAAAWRSWSGWVGYCAAGAVTTTVSSCTQQGDDPQECRTRTTEAPPTASPRQEQSRGEGDPCQEGTGCGDPIRPSDRGPAGPGTVMNPGAPRDGDPHGRGGGPQGMS